ncbi:uncharacterized protein LODBEIA_P10610 [Lodderomyces beijingensis]|uniref:Uncharacterized protein n=1 Tax=Lodderomyces beijingensis TaxID=1775926 RepID=A0ABP0ZFA1_9ASCO
MESASNGGENLTMTTTAMAAATTATAPATATATAGSSKRRILNTGPKGMPATAPPTMKVDPSRKHSRSRSHNMDAGRRIFHPLHHDGRQMVTTSSPIPVTAPPLSPSLKKPPSTPKLKQHQQQQQQQQQQPGSSQSYLRNQPNKASVTQPPPPPAVTAPPSSHLSHFSQPSQDTLSREEAHQGGSTPIHDHQYRTNTDTKPLDPSQRHSIAISPTPDKYKNGTRELDPIEIKKIRSTRRKARKVCRKCGLEITGQFVRALQSAFHVQCFTCHECGVQCSAKFFPQEIVGEDGLPVQVALCEYDYFKKLNLICYSCDSALRGPYITALGNKYHLEHFKCSVCQHVFDADESYYEHENNIFCHYHYSKLYASHCEGCHSSIVKQFVELFRGGKNQHWHPECFMVHKFWNVSITAESVGLQELGWSNEKLANLKLVKLSDTSFDSEKLIMMEQSIEQVVMNCWLKLSGFEQATAACISDMLLNACTGNKFNGLVVTGKLMLNLELLFKALDQVFKRCKNSPLPRMEEDNLDLSLDSDYFQQLRKEPRNITGKIMSYLAILRKSANISKSGTLSAELLSVITGCAHYLKLLIRIGLDNALKLNKLHGNVLALDEFLQTVSQSEKHSFSEPESRHHLKSLTSELVVPHNSTDACFACGKSIEKACIKYADYRWHLKCFNCKRCQKNVPEEFSRCVFEADAQGIVCGTCYKGARPLAAFTYVSDLSQLIYLLKIAFARSRVVMKIDFDKPPSPQLNNNEEEPYKPEAFDRATYVKTLDDVTRLRSKRSSQKLSKSLKKKARKSVIIAAPQAKHAQEVKNEEDLSSEMEATLKVDEPARKASGASQLSFEAGEELSVKREVQIRDEPQRQLTSVHLDRTFDLLRNEKSLTLDDIPRIVAAEQARDQRPNAFKHHNRLYQRSGSHKLKSGGHAIASTTPSSALDHILNSSTQTSDPPVGKQKFYSELTKEEHHIMRHIAIEALSQINDEKYVRDELVAQIQTKKPLTFWEKLKFGGASNSKDKAGVFGVDLSFLTRKYGADSDLGVGPSKLRIPIVVDDVINSLKQKDMSVEGIFRLNGNIKRLRELTDEINQNPSKSPDFTTQSAVQLAALMKKWLRELPVPLLTFSFYDLWISSQHEPPEVRKRVLQLTYCLLPRDHRNLLEVLLYFFSWVASFAEIDEESGSKMDTHNLATVIAPNILISKQSSQTEQGDNYFLAIEVVNQLIEQHEELSIIPADLLNAYEACGFDAIEKSLSSKEIFAHIESI